MTGDLKHRLRNRVLGTQTRQQIDDDTANIARLGNREYLLGDHPILTPGFEPPFEAFEFSAYSQNGEDGLILFLLSRIGVDTRFIVEIGTEDGRECNSANLILNYGWRGCLIEMNPVSATRCTDYFSVRAGARVEVVNAAATPENIESLLTRASVPATLDVLSIDIDSHDYWLWHAIESFSPRLVVIEYNAGFGAEEALTVPYPMPGDQHRYYHGASLAALARLGHEKGYMLVGCDSCGVNGFFVRRDLAARVSEVTPLLAFRPHRRRSRKMSPSAYFELLRKSPLQQV